MLHFKGNFPAAVGSGFIGHTEKLSNFLKHRAEDQGAKDILEPFHHVVARFYPSVILLDAVVFVLHIAMVSRLAKDLLYCRVQRGFFIGGELAWRDQCGLMALRKKGFGGRLIPDIAEIHILQVALLINGSV